MPGGLHQFLRGLMMALPLLAGCSSNGPRQTIDSDAASTSTSNTAPTAKLPAAVKPVWLSTADVERLEKSDDAAEEVDNLDAFVLVVADKDGDQRTRRIAGTALMIKTLLHSLYYPVNLSVEKHPSEDPDFYAALAEFEVRAGLKQDGVFTSKEMGTLANLAKVAEYATLGALPIGSKFVQGQEGYVSAQGTWVIQGEKVAHPINFARIDCWRSFGNCIVFDAELQAPRETSSSLYVASTVTYWEISSWSPTRVVAEQTTTCRRLALTVDVQTKQAFHVATDLTAEGCPVIGKLSAPRVTTLEDGVKVGLQVQKDALAQLEKVSKHPRSRIQQLLADSQKQN